MMALRVFSASRHLKMAAAAGAGCGRDVGSGRGASAL